MTNLTPEQIKGFENNAKAIIERIGEGKSTKQILAELYVENLPEKTMNQGLMMADAVIETVAKFDESLKAAIENKDEFISSFMDEVDAEKTCAERCNYWLKFAAVITAMSADNEAGFNREELLKSVEQLHITEDEATPELEEELRQKAREALENNTLMIPVLKGVSEQLQQIADADEAAELLVGLEGSEVDIRAVTSMLIYTKLMNGEISDAPENITIEQIVASVCAGAETAEVAEKVNNGEMDKKVATGFLTAIGIAYTITTVSGVLLIGVGAMAGLFAETILFIPMLIAASIFALYLLFKYCALVYKSSKMIVNFISKAVKPVLEGVVILTLLIICPPAGFLVLFVTSLFKIVEKVRKRREEKVIGQVSPT